MSSTIWRQREDSRIKEELKSENQGKVSKKLAVSEEVQQLILNCYNYFFKSMQANIVL